MIHANFGAVIDSCVLANQAVCDLFLRLAETPRLYVPHWSEEILQEVKRTHEKLNWPGNLVESWQKAVRTHFPESLVCGHEKLVDSIKNDPKDRHLVAAAIKSHCEVIITFNLKHFHKEILSVHGIRAEHPSEFLINLYNIDGGIFMTKLIGISERRSMPVAKVVESLSKFVPDFTEFLSDSSGISN